MVLNIKENKEIRDKNYFRIINKTIIQPYIKNPIGNLDLNGLPINRLPKNLKYIDGYLDILLIYLIVSFFTFIYKYYKKNKFTRLMMNLLKIYVSYQSLYKRTIPILNHHRHQIKRKVTIY